ncbi:hypothetical protein LJC60_10450 [Ruminococcaceae bacterium OttesenSCG-928-D13]|nr:hypothetical protein [Ruminococcaceae bacterium OttesenSCG-928-D13]
MLSMRPIDEPDVIELLNGGRFEGNVEGYMMMDGPEYLGHALFEVKDGVTTVLDSGVEEFQNLDGIVRACVAAGENRGAKLFAMNMEHPPLAKWWELFCKDMAPPVSVDHIFKLC